MKAYNSSKTDEITTSKIERTMAQLHFCLTVKKISFLQDANFMAEAIIHNNFRKFRTARPWQKKSILITNYLISKF